MKLYKSKLYLEDVQCVSGLKLPWDKLQNKSIVLSGASGLIGSFLVDVILNKDASDGLNCKIYALGRSLERARERFSHYLESDYLQFVSCDLNRPLDLSIQEEVHYVIHLASNTHPVQYATDPIGTITTNIMGLQSMLAFAVDHKAERFMFASSNEIYGENRGDVELFDEEYCGYINSNTLRAGYSESKRCGEAFCQAYKEQLGLNIVIPRFTRSYGPTMRLDDTKAISQFIKKAVDGQNIVLKSKGTQMYSYTYVADAVSGLLTVLLCGCNGHAYNIADESSDMSLKDIAQHLAQLAGTKVVYEVPDQIEQAGYSTATKARLDGRRIKELRWSPRYDINEGLRRTFEIIREIRG